jgi:hypothetical protein
MDSFAETIAAQTERYLALWSETPAAFPDSLRRFSSSARAEKEGEVEILLEKTIPRLDHYGDMDQGARERYLGRAHTALGRLMTGEGDPEVNRFFEECESAGKLFVRRAREHDPALSDDDIHQALRNQWVFNSMQSSLSHPVTLTSASLGYSLMYPCTDNLLDGPVRTHEEKIRFNRSLASCLQGNTAECDSTELRGFPALLQMVEEDYPRGEFPDVYRSLRAIHAAQERSLLLHAPVGDRQEGSLQSLTIEKGGASVVVDGVLVSGTLAPDALHAFFGYGVVLQFIDDLQDIPHDAAAGHSTMFTRLCRRGPLDEITGRLINFTCSTIRLLDGVSPAPGAPLSGVIRGSCMFLILEAVARYPQFFSLPFLAAAEEFSPLRFTYLGGLHDRVRTALAAREHSLFPA